MLKWIVTCNQPFTEVEQEAFLEMVKTLNPQAESISDSTMKRDLMATYLKKVEEIKEHLKKVPGKISFTVDAWTSKNMLPFMAVRAHWINTEWKYETVLLDFMYIDGGHSGKELCDLFIKCVKRFEIPLSKILAVTMDNATNDTFMSELEKHGIEVDVDISKDEHQVRCMAHILNLSVQDILSSLNIPLNYEDDESACEDLEDPVVDNEDESDNLQDEPDIDEDESDEEQDISNQPTIQKIRKLVRKIRKSPQKRQKLMKLCNLYKIKYLTPILDVATRWNSTFLMIERAEKLRTPLRAFCASEKSLNGFVMNEYQWTELQAIKKFLKKFDRATKLVSMERHPTFSAYLPTLNWLLDSLKEFIRENPGALAIAARKGLEKLEKYKTLIFQKQSFHMWLFS